MSVPPTPSKIARPTPFTPKRPLSMASYDDIGRGPPSRATTPSLIPPSAKKYKAALTSEARPRTMSKPPSPTKRAPGDGTHSRPRTPTTPKRGSHSPLPMVVSEMDVSRVDPEDALVDFETVEAGDISVDLDQVALNDYGREDKVLVSIRYVVCFRDTYRL
jgi:centromeric protein E